MRIILGISLAAMAAAAIAAPAGAQPSRNEWSTQGRIEDSDSQDADQQRYDDHRIRLEAGRRYRISAESEDFDTLIRLFGPGGTEPVAENDDSGGGLNSRITFTPEQSGDYTLRVLSFSQEGRGAYTASAGTVPPLPPPVSTPGTNVPVSGSWSLWQGSLDAGDADTDGHHYDDYLIHVEAGQARYIAVNAQAFDTTVSVITPDQRDSDSPEVLEMDDDTGVGVNSLVAFAPEASGDYIVRVSSYEEDATGPYWLYISQ